MAARRPRLVAESEEPLALLEAEEENTGPAERSQSVRLASQVQESIATSRSSAEARRFMVLLTALLLILVVGQVITLYSGAPTRWVTRGAVCLLAVGWFAWQRENPFSLNTQLELNQKITL